ncbi:hypothetical protein ACIRPK_27550 [Kitasatospora sp. NPDC101801]|uniref:hypothetical protein n=1 Tax=Kitasatospora sp. NPDC101801 TaxID=3364103 RepID=UPI0037F6751D
MNTTLPTPEAPSGERHEAGCAVLVLEFANEIPRRSLEAVLPEGPSVVRHRIDPLANPALLVGPHPVAEQAAHWLGESALSEGPLLVVAYCSGAVLAQALAEAWPGQSSVLLLDPADLGPDDPQALLVELARKLDGGVDLANLPELRGRTEAAAFDAARSFLVEVLTAVAPDLPAPIAESLVGKQLAWFSYGLAASAHETRVRQPTRVFLSEGIACSPPWAGARVEMLPLPQAELFTADAVRTAAEEAVAVLTAAHLGALPEAVA